MNNQRIPSTIPIATGSKKNFNLLNSAEIDFPRVDLTKVA
jgi:hypothetical protein